MEIWVPLFAQVKFQKKVFPKRVDIYENYNGGAVTRLKFMQGNNEWYTAWVNNAAFTRIKTSRILSVSFEVSLKRFKYK